MKMNVIKTFTLWVLLACTCISFFPVCAQAVERPIIVRYADDGSYMVESITYLDSRASGTISGNKNTKYYDENGALQWTVTVTGTFSYNGSSATCTASSCSVSISNSEWYTISKSASKSGSSATGSATMGKKVLGTTISKVSSSVTLTCDANGNLS